MKSHAVNKVKKSSDYYKELSRQKLWPSPHQHVPPRDLCWVIGGGRVCVVLSARIPGLLGAIPMPSAIPWSNAHENMLVKLSGM